MEEILGSRQQQYQRPQPRQHYVSSSELRTRRPDEKPKSKLGSFLLGLILFVGAVLSILAMVGVFSKKKDDKFTPVMSNLISMNNHS